MNNWKWFLLTFIAGVLCTGFAFGAIDGESVKILNKALNVAFVLMVYILYKIKFNGKSFDVDKSISENPMAVAIEHGLLVVAVSIATSLG